MTERRCRVAVIGGTGAPSLGEGGEALAADALITPYGAASPATVYPHRGVLFLNRHGDGDGVLPHLVRYRANVHLLHRLGVEVAAAVFAVGGIEAGLDTGDFVLPAQLIDYTWGREQTFAPEHGIRHVEFGEPFHPHARAALREAADAAGVPVRDGGTYGCAQGPRLETAAEIDRMERDGCTVVGMTAMPEAALARELGIAYAGICLVVNPAAGRGGGAIDVAAIRAAVADAQAPLARVLGEFVDRAP